MTETGDIQQSPARIVQGLWVGSELSLMERLSIASFLDNGHEYHLYVYGDVRNVPDGTTIRDGGEILHESLIFQYKNHKSFSAFANFFVATLREQQGVYKKIGVDVECRV